MYNDFNAVTVFQISHSGKVQYFLKGGIAINSTKRLIFIILLFISAVLKNLKTGERKNGERIEGVAC